MSACFFCKNSVGSIDSGNWVYNCKFGIDTSQFDGEFEDVLKCPKAKPRWGFQIGGYYTHMWFEQDGDHLTWHIEGDGEFPTPGRTIEFYICDFKQIERFVKLWGDELRKRGWIAQP